MSVAIKVGPPVLTVNSGSTFMVTDLNGEIDGTKSQGVFAEDTRFISNYQIYINDRPWQCVTSAAVTYNAALLNLTNPEVLAPDGLGTIEEHTIALTLRRQIDTSLHELFHIVNYSEVDVDFMLELAMRSDFADLFEVKAERRTRRGQIETNWNDRRRELTTSYQHSDFSRRVVYHVRESSSQPGYANGRLVFEINLKPGAAWDARSTVLLVHQGRSGHAAGKPRHAGKRAPRRQEAMSGEDLLKLHEDWLNTCTGLKTPNNSARSAYVQSIDDLGALRLPEHDLGPDVWVPAAGVPWFVALFGRDSLLVAYQTMMAHAPFARGALRTLAHYQASERDDWRDAQPGKILHELRNGELAHFRLVPFTPYYGTADATLLYLIVLHEYYKWTGDLALVKELRDVADRCLEWIDTYGDLDGDGFQEWKTFSDKGYENMAWKDSGTAIVYRDGAQTKQPKGTCELQGYVYDAKLRMAELYDALDDGARADKLRQQAATLQQKFNETFWMEDEGCYALGLDGEKKQIDAVASNAGHCLWSGIAAPERAKRVAVRLLAPDMWCGWGIRTLSARNPAYNPASYQQGSVWPHDNGIIAAGLKRYGFADEANQIAEGIFTAASFFDSFRLPEVFAGFEREPATFPSQYVGANIPQAWAAGSILHLVRTMLGLRPDAPNGVLYVNPTLPDWLPELELERLKIGGATLNLRFWRDGDGSHFEVKHHQGKKIEVKLEGSTIPAPCAAGPSDAGDAPMAPPAQRRKAKRPAKAKA